MRRVKLAYLSELDDQHATLYIPTVLEGGNIPSFIHTTQPNNHRHIKTKHTKQHH